jgi:hypothetical protein
MTGHTLFHTYSQKINKLKKRKSMKLKEEHFEVIDANIKTIKL